MYSRRMKNLICLAILSLSLTACSALEKDITQGRDQLTLEETRARLQSVKLQMCKERSEHSIKCSANCDISKAWHKAKWGK